MPVYDTYAKRKRAKEKAGEPDVYQYDEVRPFLREQLRIILVGAFGYWHYDFEGSPDRAPNSAWNHISHVLEREVREFPRSYEGDPQTRCLDFLEKSRDVDNWLTLVEVACQVFDHMQKHVSRQLYHEQHPDDALVEINTRFREHAFGYEYANGEIIRIDDQFVHAEVVKPTLQLLLEPGFEKANEDFMTAHRHLRENKPKDAIVAANRAFEATLKAICKARGWTYPNGARASDLVTVVRKAGLFPGHLGAGLDTYISMLKTGLPNVRNNAGAHGDAPDAPAVQDHLATYAIHLTAANILLVVKAHLHPPVALGDHRP